jgi:hypothetical protein
MAMAADFAAKATSGDPRDTGLLFGGGLGTLAVIGTGAGAARMGLRGAGATEATTTSVSTVRSLDIPASLRGITTEEFLRLIPDDWLTAAGRGPGVTRYAPPRKPGVQILTEPGSPAAPLWDVHSGPYLRISTGTGPAERVPMWGNPSLWTVKP